MTTGRKTTFDERIEIVQYCIAHDHNYAETDNTTLKIISNITVTLSAAVFFVQLAQKLTEIAVALL